MTKRKSDDIFDDDATVIAAKKAKPEPDEAVMSDGNATVERRSSRLAAKRSMQSSTAFTQQQQFDSDSDSDCSSVKRKGRKKPRKSGSKKAETVRRKNSKVGRLEFFMRMPMDIFCEIAASLSPYDLLNMARSFKALRVLLTSKDSKAIWRAAREAMGLPDCPSDLTEMQYADLLFCKGCNLCDAPRAQRTYFPFRLRLCGRCRNTNFVSSYYLKRYFERDDDFLALLPSIESGYGIKFFHVNEAEAVWKEYQSLSADSDERAKFVADRKKRVADIEDGTAKSLAWISLQRLDKMAEQRKIIKEREHSVTERLKLIGYTDMDLDCTLDTSDLRSRWDKLLKDPRPLTDRIWKNIKPKAKKVILERRVRRLALENLASFLFHDLDCDCYHCIAGADSNGPYCDCPRCNRLGYMGPGDSDSDSLW